MEDGEVIEQGTVLDIFTIPQRNLTKTLSIQQPYQPRIETVITRTVIESERWRLLSENFIRRCFNRGTVDYEIIDSIPSSSEHLIRERGNHPRNPVGHYWLVSLVKRKHRKCTFLH